MHFLQLFVTYMQLSKGLWHTNCSFFYHIILSIRCPVFVSPYVPIYLSSHFFIVSLSPPSFTTEAGKWLLTLKLEYNSHIWIWWSCRSLLLLYLLLSDGMTCSCIPHVWREWRWIHNTGWASVTAQYDGRIQHLSRTGLQQFCHKSWIWDEWRLQDLWQNYFL